MSPDCDRNRNFKESAKYSGDGVGRQYDARTFVDTLLEAVKIAREKRALMFEHRSRSRALEDLQQQLDTIRLYLQWIENEYAWTAEEFESEEALQRGELAVEADIRDCQARLGEQQIAIDRSDSRLDEVLKRLYSMGRHITAESWPDGSLVLSPLFWRALRLCMAGADLIAGDLAAVAQAEAMLGPAKEAVQEATTVVQSESQALERDPLQPVAALQVSLAKLDRAIAGYRGHEAQRKQLCMALQYRRREQHRLEAEFLHKRAAPCLEAAGLIPRDWLRFSEVEEESPGEPVIVVSDPTHQLTDDQYEDLREAFDESVVEMNGHKSVLDDMEMTYPDRWRDFFTVYPGASREDFDRHDLMAGKQATHQFIESEAKNTSLRNQMRKTNRIDWLPRLYDFAYDESDEKHAVPRTAAQLEQKAQAFPETTTRVEEWTDQLSGDHPLLDGSTEVPIASTTRRWEAKPVNFRDPDQYSGGSIAGYDESRSKKRLLQMYQVECNDLRLEMKAKDRW